MRRSRRGGGSHSEFASSGEDSFVAVVVTKLTGALLFILLLTMVIMALLPKAVDLGQPEDTSQRESKEGEKAAPLEIATPTTLPDAVAGRPYHIALAATGGHGPLRWSASGAIPEWLTLDESTGRMRGMPPKRLDKPVSLVIEVSDGKATASQAAMLEVLEGKAPSTIVAALRNLRLPWPVGRAWLEQGVGFLVLWLVHLLGMNLIANLERGSLEESDLSVNSVDAQLMISKRFTFYRFVIRLVTVSTMIALVGWLVFAHSHGK